MSKQDSIADRSRFKIAMFFKVVKIVKFSAIIGPSLLINLSN